MSAATETTAAPGRSEKTAYSVAQVTDIVRRLVRQYARIFVTGEISGWRVQASGHAYFTLKDADAVLPCVMFASSVARCRAFAALRDGVQVCLFGHLDVYAPQGRYQLVAEAAKIAGEGDLAARFNALKAKLEAEGLFDPARKVPLPFLPHRVGIVTSPTGAVIHDMCTVMTRRFPNVEIVLYPVKVQGPGAKEEICAGLGWMDAHGFDVIIVGRGGGSIEDLWCFNEEEVVRAVAAMKTPVVSAVGHETDFTLCDFAADVRAGTPSIAAETVMPEKEKLVRKVTDLRARLVRAPRYALDAYAQRVDGLAVRLAGALRDALARTETRLVRASQRLAPALNASAARTETRLVRASQRLAPALNASAARAETRLVRASQRLDPLARAAAADAARRLEALAAKLPLLDPENPLKRGYAIAFDAHGNVIRDAATVPVGSALRVKVRAGEIAAERVA